MADVSLRHINKIYDNNVQAVFDFNLEIKDKEFIVFVGPSGCGKSTTLRMVAGLEDISTGELYIDGRYSNNLAPQSRDIALVFQNYALYPHMTVYENMAFGLRNRKVPLPLMVEVEKTPEEIASEESLIQAVEQDENKNEEQKRIAIEKIKGPKLVQKTGIDKFTLKKIVKDIDAVNKAIRKDPENVALVEEKERLEKWYHYFETTEVPLYKIGHLSEEEIHERIVDAAKILDITQYLKRKPKALSGGQCQRVALGRAIVRHAKVFLMDEPLSNLDAKLRVQMRSEIIKLHKNIGATTIYVTHDQTEAMTMADRIVCMKFGYIQQIGRPEDIYNKPFNRFVATFIGSPAMNIVPAKFNADTLTVSKDMVFKLTKAEQAKIKEIHEEQLKIHEEKLIKATDNKETFIKNHKKKLSKKNRVDLAMLEASESSLKEGVEKYQDKIKANKGDILIGFRPEHVSISLTPTKGYYKAQMDVTEMMGDATLIHAVVGDTPVSLKCGKEFHSLTKGLKTIYFSFERKNLYMFDAISEKAIYADEVSTKKEENPVKKVKEKKVTKKPIKKAK